MFIVTSTLTDLSSTNSVTWVNQPTSDSLYKGALQKMLKCRNRSAMCSVGQCDISTTLPKRDSYIDIIGFIYAHSKLQIEIPYMYMFDVLLK